MLTVERNSLSLPNTPAPQPPAPAHFGDNSLQAAEEKQ